MFRRDLRRCQSELSIESPFITSGRIAALLPEFRRLRERGVVVVINTKHPDEHDQYFKVEALQAIRRLKELGVRVLFTGGHHRKVAIVDRKVLYEGWFNILSQRDSCESMRRIEPVKLTREMVEFVGMNKWLAWSVSINNTNAHYM